MELLSLLEVVDEQVNNSEVNTETEVDKVVVVEGIEVVLTRLQIPESFSRFLTFLR